MGKIKTALLLTVALLSGCDKGDGIKLSSPTIHYDTVDTTQQDIDLEKSLLAEVKSETYKKRMKHHFYWDVPLSRDLQDYISDLCKKYGVDERLAYAVIMTESRFDPNVVSETSDYGLFQVNLINHVRIKSELGITDFLDPYQNSKAGIYMLSRLQKYNDNHIILMAYNGGEGYMKKLVSRGQYSTEYSREVISNTSKLKRKKVE